MDSWSIYIGFVLIILTIAFFVGIYQRYTLCVVLFLIGYTGLVVGAMCHYLTPTNDDISYNYRCGVATRSYEKGYTVGFEDGVNLIKQEED